VYSQNLGPSNSATTGQEEQDAELIDHRW
jgi:hypothetical protein